MDVLAFFADPTVRDIGAVSLLVIVVTMILTGRLVPSWTHRRELDSANKRGDEHKQASDKKDEAIQLLLQQNATLLAGVRIADKFYGDFLPDSIGNTGPGPGVQHVGP
jgi:hypothetical protein